MSASSVVAGSLCDLVEMMARMREVEEGSYTRESGNRIDDFL